MMNICLNFQIIVLSVISIIFVNATPQLDLPPQNDSYPIRDFLDKNRRKIQTNGHSSSKLSENSGEKDQSNENGVDANIQFGDPLNYDRDRSQRFGPPYTEDSDRHYYNNFNGLQNQSSSSFYDNTRNYPNDNGGDDDDKYHVIPRKHGTSSDPYYVSQRERNRYAYDDYQKYYQGNYDAYNPYDRNRYNDDRRLNDGNRYDDRYYNNRNRYNERNPYSNDPEYNRPFSNDPDYNRQNNDPGSNRPYNERYPDRNRPNFYDTNYPNQNPNSNYNNDNYDDRNRYSNEDYERYRLELERKNRIEDANLRRVLDDVDKLASSECFNNVAAQWSFETNVNDVNQQESILAQQRYSAFQRELWEKVQTIDKNRIFDDQLYRQVRYMSIIGPNALPADSFDRYNRLINDMLAIYNKAQICAFDKLFDCGLKLYPDLKEIMAHSRDWDELVYVWGEWRRKSGENMKEMYEQLVDLTNEAARYNNFSNAAEYWTFPFELYNIREDAEQVWREILPLYELLHSYVRRKLREYYGPNRISRSAPLPDHVLGNMYSQTWTNVMDITIPFPGRSFIDVTREMREQGYTPQIMFQIAEEFFLSINMTALPTDFWLESILERPPPERQLLCQPSAWDFCNRNTYRIKMCTNVNQKDLITVHHEMMHVQYFLSYRHQPKVFRDGANAAFHEALGDTIALSVSTPKHLQTIGLVQKSIDDTAHDINFLFSLAMDKVAFLPFALTMDMWRWDVFERNIVADQYNCHWWLLREKYGGIKPPVLRSEMDFDPGAKFHIPANIPYIRYYFATVLQFQIHRALCKESLQYDPNDVNKPLHKCDIYRQPVAGNILKQIMEKGSSQPWQDVLQETLGEGRLDGTALREYFRPLEEWLRQENLRTNEFVGWTYDGDYCKHSIDTANLQVYGGFYNGAINVRSTGILIWLSVLVVALMVQTTNMQ